MKPMATEALQKLEKKRKALSDGSSHSISVRLFPKMCPECTTTSNFLKLIFNLRLKLSRKLIRIVVSAERDDQGFLLRFVGLENPLSIYKLFVRRNSVRDQEVVKVRCLSNQANFSSISA